MPNLVQHTRGNVFIKKFDNDPKCQAGDNITRLKNAINNIHHMLTSTVSDRSN
jgi:hypothetical protein